MINFIDGKKLASTITQRIKNEVKNSHLNPGLAIILVGDDPASQIYVKLKKEAAHEVGIEFYEYLAPSNTNEQHLKKIINWLNQDSRINGIVLQLPLPKHLSEDRLVTMINPLKDADGFHPKNLKLLSSNKSHVKPAITKTVLSLLKATGETLNEKTALIIANSPVFAKPLRHELKTLNIKSNYCDPKSPGIKQSIKNADIIIVAVGKPKFLNDQDCKEGSIVIDVGINRVRGKTCGDVNSNIFSQAKNIKWLTPVPGGVGPVTIAMLLENVVELTKKQTKRKSPALCR